MEIELTSAEWLVVWEALAQYTENTDCAVEEGDESKLSAARTALEKMDSAFVTSFDSADCPACAVERPSMADHPCIEAL